MVGGAGGGGVVAVCVCVLLLESHVSSTRKVRFVRFTHTVGISVGVIEISAPGSSLDHVFVLGRLNTGYAYTEALTSGCPRVSTASGRCGESKRGGCQEGADEDDGVFHGE